MKLNNHIRFSPFPIAVMASGGFVVDRKQKAGKGVNF